MLIFFWQLGWDWDSVIRTPASPFPLLCVFKKKLLFFRWLQVSTKTCSLVKRTWAGFQSHSLLNALVGPKIQCLLVTRWWRWGSVYATMAVMDVVGACSRPQPFQWPLGSSVFCFLWMLGFLASSFLFFSAWGCHLTSETNLARLELMSMCSPWPEWGRVRLVGIVPCGFHLRHVYAVSHELSGQWARITRVAICSGTQSSLIVSLFHLLISTKCLCALRFTFWNTIIQGEDIRNGLWEYNWVMSS